MVKPGEPILVLDSVVVQGEVNGEVSEHDIGGWVAMPQEHFEVLMERARP